LTTPEKAIQAREKGIVQTTNVKMAMAMLAAGEFLQTIHGRAGALTVLSLFKERQEAGLIREALGRRIPVTGRVKKETTMLGETLCVSFAIKLGTDGLIALRRREGRGAFAVVPRATSFSNAHREEGRQTHRGGTQQGFEREKSWLRRFF